MDESSSDDCDVVVVGGGLSGLAAARTLIQHDSSLRVTLLEANDICIRIVTAVQTLGLCIMSRMH